MERHWVDDIIADARETLREIISIERDALKGPVPIGTRVLSKREQLEQFEQITPSEHQAIAAEKGPEEHARYVEAQVENARQIHGEEYAAQLMNTLTFLQAGYGEPTTPEPEVM